MNCPQCNTNLPDTATFCYKCGSSIRPTTFSYLPEGTPVWPTTVPQSHFYTPKAAGQVVPQGEHSDATFKFAPSKPRRSARSIMIVLALLVLTPIVGILATLGTLWMNGSFPGNAAAAPSVHVPVVTQQTPTPANSLTPTPSTAAQGNQLPTPTSFQTANGSVIGVIVKYPSDWVADTPQTSANSSALGFHPQQRDGIFISIERFTASASAKIGSTSEVNQSNMDQLSSSQNVHNFHLITSPMTQRSVGGEQWDEQDAAITNSNGVNFHITSIAVQHNHYYYDILFYSPDTYYNEAVQKYFQPMFDSFQFQG